MYFTSCIGDAIRIPLRLTCLSCPASASASYNSPELLQWRNPPSQRSSTPGSISRCLRSSPILRQPSQSDHPHGPTQSRWDRHGFARQVVHLLHLFFTLHVIYIVQWAHAVTWNMISFSDYMTSSEVPGNLAIRDGLSWMPSLFISAHLSCAFVDGPGSWASRAVAWVRSNRSSTKTFF